MQKKMLKVGHKNARVISDSYWKLSMRTQTVII